MKSNRKVDLAVFNCLPEVRSLGAMQFDPIWAQKTHVSRLCELIHVIRGHVRVKSSWWRLAGQPGGTILIPTGTAHRDDFNLAEKLEVFMVFFNWKAERDFFAVVTPARLQALSASTRAEVTRLFHHLRMDSGQGTPEDQLVVRAQVAAILMVILRDALRARQAGSEREAEDYGQQRREWLIHQTRQFLTAHLHQPISLDRIAQALKVSPFYLSHVFSQETDFSLFAYLNRLRMEKAAELLKTGKWSIKEIAAAVGYDDSSYFTKVFRKHFGRPPHSLARHSVAPLRPQ